MPPPYDDQIYSGVPDLSSESLDTWEIGYLGDWRDWRSSLDVRLFRIDLDYDASDPDIGNSTIPIQNVRIQGGEYQLKWQPFETTKVVFNQAFAHVDADYLASALALSRTTLSAPKTVADGKPQQIEDFTEDSMPCSSTSILLMQKLPLGLEFSTAAYWQGKMKWSTHMESLKYHRVDAHLGYPFRTGSLGGEIAFTVQSLNGAHNEYKWSSFAADRVVERRQWVSLRLDF